MRHRRLISAKEIAKEFGISYQTVNNYTDLGLFDVVQKRNHLRMYDYNAVKRRMSKVIRFIDEGYTLSLICKMINEERRR